MPLHRKKIGLALSGGAVLGIAHLGAIKVLEEHRIPIDLIAGTSAGSLVGAFLAAGYTSDEMFDLVKSLSWGKISKVTLPKMGLLNSKLLGRLVDTQVGRIDIKQLPKPYAAVAVDLTSGHQVILQTGLVSEAVRASCCIPGVFTPVIRGDQVLVDGGVLNFLPADVVRQMGADYVIAVKLKPGLAHDKRPDSIFQVLMNSFQLTIAQIAEHAPNGDITIMPDLSGLNPHDFRQADKLYQRGYEAATAIIQKIEADLSRTAKRFSLFRWLK
ncbi:MAG: patatin-like phospholipase family protein [candidate division KSB1 bacterium]|nr:patatin-like phospholipase family protein [candidate division KSB1 bacterium]MDZ7318881.1 patatin-like phospholipase family protein [candidate division KSB1 bacterium]MDZ7342490.1 patatin-like phospholipase family protein [candidate division KSB1 bacterium]